MKPIVNLYKLGRMPYVKTLNVQRVLFENLKASVTGLNKLNSRGSNNTCDENQIPLASNKSGIEQFNCFDNKLDEFIATEQQQCQSSSIFDQFSLEQATGNSLILVEHEPVYTIGIRAKQYNETYVTRLKERLAEHKLKADFIKTNRGGLITFHGPGQLVAYPIIHLGDFTKTIQNKSVKVYVNLLEATIIDTLARIGIKGAHTVKEYPGVWLDGGERKIAFIGISCKRYVTMHGISINCNCDLSWFDHIVSCGIEDKLITSVRQELFFNDEHRHHKLRHLAIDSKPNSLIDDDINFEHLSWPPNHTACDRSLQTNQVVDTTMERSTKFSVDNVAKAFCLSFSQHFDCELIETFPDTFSGTMGQL